jgi:hypothetical protein
MDSFELEVLEVGGCPFTDGPEYACCITGLIIAR